MARFVDAAGRAWDVRITVADLPRLKAAGLSVAEAGADLARVGKAFMADPEAFGKAVWLLIEKQAVAAGVSLDDFLAGLDGPTAFACVEAMEEAIADFTRPPAISKKIREMLPAARAKANQAMERATEAAIADAMSRIETPPSGGPAGGSPGSPASTPAP